jgi:hypothetical protein
MKIPTNKLLKIFWHDHASNACWQDLKEVKKWGNESYTILCETIGECIFQNSKYIIINAERLPDKDSDDVQYGLKTIILRKDIEKIEKV